MSDRWEECTHTTRQWVSEREGAVLSVDEAGHDGTGAKLYRWEVTVGDGSTGAYGSDDDLARAQATAEVTASVLIGLIGWRQTP